MALGSSKKMSYDNFKSCCLGCFCISDCICLYLVLHWVVTARSNDVHACCCLVWSSTHPHTKPSSHNIRIRISKDALLFVTACKHAVKIKLHNVEQTATVKILFRCLQAFYGNICTGNNQTIASAEQGCFLKVKAYMIDTLSKYRRDRLRMLLHRGIEANYENSKLVLSPRMPFGWI